MEIVVVHERLINTIDSKSKEKNHLQNTMIKRGMEIFIRTHESLSVIPPLVDVKPTKAFVGLWAKCDRKRIICSAYPTEGFTLWELYPDFNIPRRRQHEDYLQTFNEEIRVACELKQHHGIYPKHRSSSSSGGLVKIKIPNISWTKNCNEIDELILHLATITYSHMSPQPSTAQVKPNTIFSNLVYAL